VKRIYLLPAAYFLDQLAGDPEWFPHPVRIMGLAITRGEKILLRQDHSSMRKFLTGAALTASLITSSYLVTRTSIRLAYRLSKIFGLTTEILLAWTCLAVRNLHEEAQAVSAALNQDNLPLARLRIARIVGRDTQTLDESEVSRALIETLAESASDGIVAPILYLALGGAPLAMAYKAVNTLDSMIGHRNQRYLYFGKFAARLDDIANYLPARLTALCIVMASSLIPHTDPRASWSSWHRDADRHKSPNAGQPEAAIAGALHVQLGGDNRYDGELIRAPLMGAQFPSSTPVKARQAIRLIAAVSILGLAIGTLLATSRKQRAGSCN